jgi:hypothetical protein
VARQAGSHSVDIPANAREQRGDRLRQSEQMGRPAGTTKGR